MAKNTSSFIRNLIILLDFIVANAVLSTYYYYDIKQPYSDVREVTLPFLLLIANAAMALSQLFYSNILEGHYRNIDKVLRQVTFLSCVYAVLFLILMEGSKFFFGTQSPYAPFTVWYLVFTVVALIASRLVEYLSLHRLRKIGRNSRSLLFVGEADQIANAYVSMNINTHVGLRVLGYYSDTEIKDNPHVKIPHLGSINDLNDLLEDEDLTRLSDDIYCTELPKGNALITRLVDYSVRRGIQFNYVPPFISDFGYCLSPRVEGELVVFSNLNEPLLSFGNRLIKRSFDLVVSGVTILLLLPFIPIIGAIIKLSSPGPIFFKQKRTGFNGEEFSMIKFRSMHVNKDADLKQATKDDPRKFAFGNFMRKTNIDELPQVFNVFMGDMSIVGPRPHMLAHTDEYRKKIYEYMLRHLVRPGITGWAQVTGFRGETPELWQMEGRVQRDLWYIQNWTFWLDIRIIYRTAMQTFRPDKNAF